MAPKKGGRLARLLDIEDRVRHGMGLGTGLPTFGVAGHN